MRERGRLRGTVSLRRDGLAAAAVASVLGAGLVRLLVGGPYPGAAFLLLLACGLALLPLMPRELSTPSLRLAVLPALALASFSALLTKVSILGIPLTEVTIWLAVAAFVVVAIAAVRFMRRDDVDNAARSLRSEAVVIAALVALFAFAVASSWDVVYPLQAEGTDWGHYLLYADEAATQEGLLIDDPLAGEDGRVFADPPAVGAVYASFLILDGVTSWSLGFGIVVLSAVAVLSTFAAAGALWGAGPGLVAAAAFAVAPIRLDPMYWHGLGTTLAFVFLPLVALALGLMFRGRKDWRTVALLALALVGVAASHSTTAVIVGVLVVVAPLLDLVRRLVARPEGGAPRSWWRDGPVKPVLAAVVVAAVGGLGVIAHLRSQAADLGRPVSYRFLGPDWLDREAVAGYYSWAFLAFAGAALALVLTSRRLRGDPALLALVALAAACVVVSQSWRVEFPFEYRRVVYPLGVALVLLMGAAFTRFRARLAWVAVWVLAFVYVAQVSIGLRLPQRVLEGMPPKSPAVSGLESFRARLDAGDLPDTPLLVSDACLHFAVPYLVRRPTIPAFGERQVGFEDRLTLARKASTILEGGPAGRALADQLGVDYAVVDPRCTPDLASLLGGEVVFENDEVQVLVLSARG